MRSLITLLSFSFSGILLNAQNVGINTTNPDRPLTIRALGDNNELLSLRSSDNITRWHVNIIENGLNFSLTGQKDQVLFLEDSGRVGIGTSKPYTALHVQLPPNQSEAITIHNPIFSSENLAYLTFRASDFDPQIASYGYSFLGAGKNYDIGGYMVFGTPPTYSAEPQEKMRLVGNGNFGIGTSSPQSRLHVKQGNGSTISTFETGSVIGNIVVRSSTREIQLGLDGLGGVMSIVNNEDFRLNTATNTRIYVSGSTGNVAIGSTVAQEKLHVQGTGRFDTGIKLANTTGNNLLNYYEEYSVNTSVMSGNVSLLSNVPLRVVRIGKMVQITLPDDVINLSPLALQEIKFSVELPERFRPNRDAIRFPLQILNNGSQGTGYLVIAPNGLITIRPNISNSAAIWSGVNNAGFYASGLSYSL